MIQLDAFRVVVAGIYQPLFQLGPKYLLLGFASLLGLVAVPASCSSSR